MRPASKLFLSVALALAALALNVAVASAQIEVSEEHESGTEGHCTTLTKVEHHVEGGCHFELQTEHHISLVVQTAGGPVTLANCNVHLDGRTGEDGAGWITEAKLTPEDPPSAPSCTRVACDEANGSQIPWPIAATEASGVETVELTFCIRSVASAPGTPGSPCEVHMPLSDNGGHQHEIGDNSSYSCENLPNVSLQNVHCVNEIQDPEESKEDVEIVH